MNEFNNLVNAIKSIMEANTTFDIYAARKIVQLINKFQNTRYGGIVSIEVLEKEYANFSDFLKFWHNNYEQIIGCEINDSVCEKVAVALHDIYSLTGGNAFKKDWNRNGLSNEDICRIKLFTANQDFRDSLDFKEISDKFIDDPSSFDERIIADDPEQFVMTLGISQRSLTDKRNQYAKGIASFVMEHGCSPIELIKCFDNDVSKLRDALIECNIGYGKKTADMFIRDMVMLGVWKDIFGFEKIDVASNVNTIKIALRTGILTTAIPLESDFFDIFCNQYEYFDNLNTKAWRKVWEKWRALFPKETLESPCLIDYFTHEVIGQQFCVDNLAIFQCNDFGHVFRWHSIMNRTCQICYKEGRLNVKTHVIAKIRPCADPEGEIAILESKFVKDLPKEKKLKNCPFYNICSEHYTL